ncbi:AIPR family protein [Piscinibacter sp. Jin2]|uniref:AIPR family protein n=1 Tax=Aquariibacter lacus TaxID=2801332 RepID=A0A9X1BNG7_9BURK|nr:AIPR family protein [Piscinibacter lacus]MBL0719895.1 AIPR family protein [Piscinibacter lacus]
MTQLKVKQAKQRLLQLFESHLDLSDIKSSDPERENKVLSRCLAAYAIYLSTGCSEAEAGGAVWDGPDDNGIDAAFFDASDSQVILVQSKWINKGSGEPEAAEIGSFTKGVKDAIEQDQADFHKRLASKISDIFVRLSTPGTSVKLVLITTGASKLACHGASRLDKILEDLNGNDPEPMAEAVVLGLAEVYQSLANDAQAGAVTVEGTVLDWSFVAAPYQAYFGVIDGLTLKQWWIAYGKRLVAKNIRHSLGATEVNLQIRQTASTSPERFWYFNNGITMIAEQAPKAPAGAASRSAALFSFKGASIVNGAQTISSLSKVLDDSKLGQVRVTFRVIILSGSPPELGQEVTRTNNLQNRIEPRDFVAQDSEQSRLRTEMSIEGIDYQFVRSDEGSTTPTSCELIEVTTALACASGDPALAVQVKTGLSRIYSDLKRPPYKALFNPTVSGARAFNATVVQREIDQWIEKKKRQMPKKSGTGWGLLVHGNRILAAGVFAKIQRDVLEQPISSFPAHLASMDIPATTGEIYSKMVEAIQSHYPTNFLAVLFKNPSMSRHVYMLGTA